MIFSKTFDKNSIIKTRQQLYTDTIKLLKKILKNKEIFLNETRDIDLRAGEFETILQQKFNHKSCGGRIKIKGV